MRNHNQMEDFDEEAFALPVFVPVLTSLFLLSLTACDTAEPDEATAVAELPAATVTTSPTAVPHKYTYTH
ncbi:MAG: hypothetical protein H6662_08050 [Ardenticatenaceae bacterium]|nr:hypothetical protein [Ardenticatenaceae bacterium]